MGRGVNDLYLIFVGRVIEEDTSVIMLSVYKNEKFDKKLLF